jgi:transposase
MTHEVVDQVLNSKFSNLPRKQGPGDPRPPSSRTVNTVHKTGVSIMNKDRPGILVLAHGRAVVGIDIGKRTHAATALSPQGEILAQLASFPNTRAGLDRLEREVLLPAGGPGKVLVAMEATGHYWMCLRAALERRGYATVVLNPIQTNARCNAQIRKTRNDRIDSVSIARVILAGEARATRVPDDQTAELRLLTRHRRRLLRAVGDLERYAHTLVDRIFPEYADVFSHPFLPSGEQLIRQVGLAPDALLQRPDQVRDVLRRTSRRRLGPETMDQLLQAAQTSIGLRQAESVIHQQLTSILDFRQTLRAQIGQIEDELERRVQALDSPLRSLGISAILAATIHAETDPIRDFGAPDQYVAYAGLDPSLHDSGDTLRGRGKISQRGSPVLRHALYLAAFVVYRKHEYFHRLYRKHRRQGKGHRSALVIVARHLARVIWRLLTDGRPFTKRPPLKNPLIPQRPSKNPISRKS